MAQSAGPQTRIAREPHFELVRFDGPVYVVRLRGRPTGADIVVATDAMEADAGFRRPFGLVYAVTDELTGYDTSLLDVYDTERAKRRPLPEMIGVVPRTALHRMVIRAAAVGFRVATGQILRVFESEDTAITDAQAVLPATRFRRSWPAA